MGELDKFEENKRKNKPFVTAFEYFAKILCEGSQKKMAELIGTHSSRISEFKNGRKPVPADTVESLIRISATKPGMQIYKEYLYGNSDIMLLANVSDEEMAESELRKSNPDYDIMKKRLHDAESRLDEEMKTSKELLAHLDNQATATPTVEPSSIMNAALAAQMQTIESLKAEKSTLIVTHARELQAKDELIQSLRDQLAAKDQLIDEQKARLIEYRRIIDSQNVLSDYHFPIGAADRNEQKRTNI